MIVKQEIDLHEDSLLDIEFLKANYTEASEMPKQIEGRCIIHMYPISDTRDGSKSLAGYHDSINCRYNIYDCDLCTVYKTNLKDRLSPKMPCRISIYKDLSTMVIIDGGCKFGGGQEMEVFPL